MEAWDARYARGPAYHGPGPAPRFAGLLPPGARVLDLGCGAGKSLRALRAAMPAARVVGLDASRAALRWAARPAVRGDARALPFADARCDAVVIHHLLGHLGDAGRAAAAAEVARVLRPGGFVEVREFAAGDLRDGVGEPAGALTFVRGGVPTRYFAPGELRALFAALHDASEQVEERRVRFAARPRRVVVLRARRA